MELGNCIKKDNLIYFAFKSMSIGSKKIYGFIGYDPVNVERFDYISMDEEKIKDEIICENFVPFNDIYEHLFKLINYKKTKLIALAFDYGEDWYDSEDEDELAQYVYLYCRGKVIQIGIPKSVRYTSDNYQIPAVYISEINKENIDELKGRSHYYFFDDDVVIENLTENYLDEYFTKYDYFIKSKDIKYFTGIKLNDVLVADFDKDSIIAVGNGIFCNMDEMIKKEIYEEKFIEKIKKMLED